jgi:deazaflavin-dependent oxidoreductase (nitroreductase family)
MATSTVPDLVGASIGAAQPTGREGAAWQATTTAFVKRHAVLIYFALTFALSWGVLLPVTRGPLSASGNDRMANPLFLLAILAAPLAPAAASVLLTGLLDGRAGYRELLGRLRHWRVGWRWYVAALLAGPLPILAAALLAILLRSPAFLPSIFTAPAPLSLVLLGVATGVMAGIFEEVGWTGFAVPRLRRQHGLLGTALLVGLVWGAWHFPVFWRGDSFSGALPFAFLLAQLFAWLPAYRVLLVAAHDRTASLPVVMLMHASLSASTLILARPNLSDAQSLANLLTWAAVLWVVAGTVVMANRRQVRSPARPRPGSPRGSPAVGVTSHVPDPHVLRAINPFMAALLRSPLHGVLSRQMFLLTVTGRRSGRQFTLPLGYVRDGDALLVVSQHSEQKRWWRNLRGGAPVALHLRGHRMTGCAEVIERPVAVAAEIERLIARLGPREASARLYMDLDVTPPLTRDQLAQALAGVVLVRVIPDRAGQRATERRAA